MGSHLLLNGETEIYSAEAVHELRAEIRRLQDEVADARTEAVRAKRNADLALGALREQLSPLYRALQAVFGELDAAGVGETATAVPLDSRKAQVWESWKQKLGGKQAEFIQAFLEHGELNAKQLKVVTHTGTSTVPQVIYKLNQLGLINKNGGKYSLKQI